MTPEPSYSQRVQRLAEWLYNRDADHYVRVSWQDDTPGLRSHYMREALAALRFAERAADTTGAMQR